MIQTPLIRHICALGTIGTLQGLTPLSETSLFGKALVKGSAKVTKEQLMRFETGKSRIKTQDIIKYFERNYKNKRKR